jgi:4-amino-4-deoxy-L-arabinose transferase-like glycosyltransferase
LKSKISTILIVAFVFRLILLLIDQYWFRLPQGGLDTESFDRWAYNIYMYWPYTFLETISNGTHVFSTFGALLYSLFGRAPMIWAFCMLLFGVGTVYNIHRGVYLITDNYKIANRAAWIACLFPNLAILSVLVLREAPIHYFLSLAILYIIKYLKNKTSISLLFFFLFGLIGAVLHSGVFALFFGFLFYQLILNKE